LKTTQNLQILGKPGKPALKSKNLQQVFAKNWRFSEPWVQEGENLVWCIFGITALDVKKSQNLHGH